MTDIEVVADRIAATLAAHDPGWQMPRMSALARRYNAKIADIQAIIDDLAARQLVRQSPDGRLYRASPADCQVAVDGLPGLGTTVDPMGGDLACLSYGVTQRPATDEAADALRIPHGEPVSVLRLTWTLNGRPAAVSTTHLARHLADPHLLTNWLTTGAQRHEMPLLPPLTSLNGTGSSPGWPDFYPLDVLSASVQMQLPPYSLTRKLRLAAGQLAVLLTVLSGDGEEGHPAALTSAVLRPDMFRVTVAAGPPGPNGRPLAAWPYDPV